MIPIITNPYHIKTSSFNMRLFVGEDIRNYIADRTQELSCALDFYVQSYCKYTLNSKKSTSEKNFYNTVFPSFFLQYVTEFVKGETNSDETFSLQFNDSLTQFLGIPYLEQALTSYSTRADDDPMYSRVMKKYITFVDEVIQNSIHTSGKISFSYSVYDTLSRLKSIYLSLDDPRDKLDSCFKRSEYFLSHLCEEYFANISLLKMMNNNLSSIDSALYVDNINDLVELENLDELEELDELVE